MCVSEPKGPWAGLCVGVGGVTVRKAFLPEKKKKGSRGGVGRAYTSPDASPGTPETIRGRCG